ncbi:hypothetical protein [Krasilnikovia sp. MM14-A1259]|uniref:hypothetical protein n=1 Tax=Krasilnikovia sp. MM14-A1259 TaxID=3373539 RepID=UPI0038251BC4
MSAPNGFPVEAIPATCAATYYADDIAEYAFVFRVIDTATSFTVYARDADRYAVDQQYALLLTPRDTVPLALPADGVEFLLHCLQTAANHWQEAIAEADDAAAPPAEPTGAAGPDHLDSTPAPAGYRTMRHLFAAELDRVKQLIAAIVEHLAHTRPFDMIED